MSVRPTDLLTAVGYGRPVDFQEPLDLPACLEACAAGEMEAFEQLYDATSGAAWTLAMLILGEQQRAEVAVRAAYLHVWNTAGHRDESALGPRAWVLSIVHHRATECRSS